MPLDAKKSASSKLNESRPIRELSIKPSTKLIRFRLCTLAGIISVINPCSSFFNAAFLIRGRLGIRVKRKRKVGGMAMIKLYATADARSVMPTVLTCLKKNIITSYKGTPSKPGR